MRKRSFNAALAGALAATIAFTAVPAQIIFASGANAQAESRESIWPQERHLLVSGTPEGSNQHCKVNVWGHMLDC